MSRLTDGIALDTKEMRAAYCEALIGEARKNGKRILYTKST